MKTNEEYRLLETKLAEAERDTQRAEGRLRQQSRKMDRVERERDQAVEFVEAHDKTVAEIQVKAIEDAMASATTWERLTDYIANIRNRAKESNNADHE